MPGAGTDKTKRWIEQPAPVVVLVETQLGENIGAAARAMANFGLARLRLVKPKQGWPNERAVVMAAGADRILDNAVVYETLADAVADCTFVLALTARNHDQAKPVLSAEEAAVEMGPRVAAGETVALVFGRERNGLENHEVGMCDRIVTLPVNPAFASLNLAQAVVVTAYEWFKRTGAGSTRAEPSRRSPPAAKQQIEAFFSDLERELEKVEFFRPPEKRGVMQVNLRNIFHRLEATKQDMRTLHGVIMALVNGSKGPARGGVLDPSQAQGLREMIAEQGAGRVRAARTPVRGLARLLRRNPTEAERSLWRAMTGDRRFASLGFKWQVPVGPHIADFVSFPRKCMIDLIPATETEPAQLARATRRAWMLAHNYRIVDVQAADVEADVKAALDRLEARLQAFDVPDKE